MFQPSVFAYRMMIQMGWAQTFENSPEWLKRSHLPGQPFFAEVYERIPALAKQRIAPSI